jgi:hypothetical protein
MTSSYYIDRMEVIIVTWKQFRIFFIRKTKELLWSTEKKELRAITDSLHSIHVIYIVNGFIIILGKHTQITLLLIFDLINALALHLKIEIYNVIKIFDYLDGIKNYLLVKSLLKKGVVGLI